MKRYKIGTQALYIEVVPKKIARDASRQAHRPTIFIKGRRIRASYTEAALLVCLFENLGHVVPTDAYARSLGIIAPARDARGMYIFCGNT